jgi:hypothetical protein
LENNQFNFTIMKNLRNLFALVLGLVVFMSCSKENVNKRDMKMVQLGMKTNTTPVLKSTATDPLVLETFQINISEIELGIDDEMEDLIEETGDTVVGPTEFYGPFLVDLLSQEALNGFILETAQIPSALYEDVEFDFDVYEASADEAIFGNSIIVKGTYNGVPFVISSTDEWEIEVEFVQPLDLSTMDKSVWIDFNLQTILAQLNTIDFANAKDGNQNGIIEIDNANTDGNAGIIEQFIDTLEESFDVEEEDEDDED